MVRFMGRLPGLPIFLVCLAETICLEATVLHEPGKGGPFGGFVKGFSGPIRINPIMNEMEIPAGIDYDCDGTAGRKAE